MATPIKWSNEFPVNTITADGQVEPAITALANGQYVVTWTDLGSRTLGDTAGTAVHGQVFAADGSKAGQEFLVNAGSTLADQTDSAIMGLPDGRFVAVWNFTYPLNGVQNTSVYGQAFNADGSTSGNTFFVAPNAGMQGKTSITGLANGDLVATWHNQQTGEIKATIIGAAGVYTNIVVDAAGGKDSSVSALENGKFIVTWEENQDIHGHIFNGDGSSAGNPFVLNTTMPGNQFEHSVATFADGHFVATWTDTSSGDADIRGQIFAANGTTLGSEFLVNTTTSGGQYDSHLTALPDGRFAAIWGTEPDNAIHGQLFNTDGTKSGAEFVVDTISWDAQSRPAITTLADGRFVVTGGAADGDAGGIGAQIFDPRESGVSLTGTALDDDLIGTEFSDTMKGGGGADHLSGKGGDDLLVGGLGADTLSGGTGSDAASYVDSPSAVTVDLATNANTGGEAQGDILNSIENLTGSQYTDTLTGNDDANIIEGGLGYDKINGGVGDDTAVFSGNFNDYTVRDFGSMIKVFGPDGGDTLTGIEHLKFDDAIIDVTDDGNPLFDSLYYLSTNPDVFQAGVNALDHYNTCGWHEGRNPNPYFDTSDYLAVNKEVAASGMSPIDHYHQIGWHEGRDPGVFFDTTLYLINNPDVAAAGIDPFAHYLQAGYAEGRTAYRAVGDIVGGFDAQFYLFQNPDVAAAGVGALQHYNQSGWHEGRNPNMWFDTAGYLSEYADVAAAGVNPLDHYMQQGWKEGRDPNQFFDTAGYLAANPDVAAAGMNPLQHYLQFGIYEGRS